MSVAAIANLDKEDTAAIGDYTRFLPGAAGLAMTLTAKDWQGLKQWLLFHCFAKASTLSL